MIETESGRKLGHVFDIRSDGEPEHGIVVKERSLDHIVYGTRGFWESVGLKKTKPDLLPWSAVKSIENGKMIVEDLPEE